MSTPSINKNSPLARILANTLGTTVKTLHNQFKSGDEIDFYQLQASRPYKDRVIGGRGYGICENAYVVDNGDGKIGRGDLFLHSDGYFRVNGMYAFRHTKLGENVATQQQNGYDARNDPRLTVTAYTVFESISRAIWRPFEESTFDIALKRLCTTFPPF